MAKTLDVYRDWLGITSTNRPLNYYQLLRLKSFEDDPAVVRTHYRKMNAHVRKFATGEFGPQSQELLNELARSMLCLTDAGRKAEYDASLGREDTQSHRQRTIEELLILRKVIDSEQLEKARRFSNAVGLDIHDAVIQQKLAKPDAVMQVYAESLGLAYIELADMTLDPTLMDRVPAVLARQHSCVPVLLDKGNLLMASTQPLTPNVEEELRLRLGAQVRSVLSTAAGINAVIAEHFSQEKASAELSAGGGTGSVPAGAPRVQLSPQEAAAEKSNRLKIAAVSFNFGFLFWMILQTVVLPAFSRTPVTISYGRSVPIALVVGLAVAGAAYFLSGRKKG